MIHEFLIALHYSCKCCQNIKLKTNSGKCLLQILVSKYQLLNFKGHVYLCLGNDFPCALVCNKAMKYIK